MLGSEPLIVGLVLERKFDLDVDCPNPKLLRVNSFPSGRLKCPNIKNMLPHLSSKNQVMSHPITPMAQP